METEELPLSVEGNSSNQASVITESTYSFEVSSPANTGISALIITQFIIGWIGISGNFLVCFVFLHRRTLRNQTNLLITNQAFIDLFSSVLLVLHTSYDLMGRPSIMIYLFRLLYCFLWKGQGLLFASFSISTFNLTIISLERFYATVLPHSYSRVFSRRNLMLTITGVWLVSPIMQCILVWKTMYFQNGECFTSYAPAWVGLMLFCWEYFIPVMFMTISFASVVRKLSKINRVLVSNTDTTANPNTTSFVTVLERNNCESTTTSQGNSRNGTSLLSTASSKNVSFLPTTSTVSHQLSTPSPSTFNTRSKACRLNSRSRNATTVLLTVYIMYIVCWSPNQLGFLYLNLGGNLNFQGYYYKISVILAIFNSCINPFIYALRHKTYKERVHGLANTLRRKVCGNQ
ncbi:Alpha-1B adrenergic receptor [Holothuria leucospilota]|uniref:Alpha-1B adrenergic receptor n=1 Tax=Holothuria leucospilota TaxID=206669 RepID=A0A9Q1H350_HOLLE|nr:Alpha-1B adrenergic receptor [Holothuria leucospilota]